MKINSFNNPPGETGNYLLQLLISILSTKH